MVSHRHLSAPDLAASEDRFSRLLGVEPYFDQPFSVGYQVAGYQLALDPHADLGSAPVTYWGVADAAAALDRLPAAGAAPHSDGVANVGGGTRVATVREVGGSRADAQGVRPPTGDWDNPGSLFGDALEGG